MLKTLSAISEQALSDLKGIESLEALDLFRISVLGKKGSLTEVLKGLGAVPAEERKAIGAAANELKRKIETALDERKLVLEQAELSSKLQSERIDISLPSRRLHHGALHPITLTTRKLISVFSRLGFDVVTGPEAETEFLNFDAVNIPSDHPARDMQDTFFLGPGVVLRTHTSSVQMRAMRAQKPPVRVICPGAVYRCDNDATHLPMFHQIEGLWVDHDVKMSDLKGVLAFFAREVFGADTEIRLRPSYFQFVEPGAEVDVSCFNCRGKKASDSCSVCRGSGWLEILGAGMVHPKLLEAAGYSSDLTGFAFGMGIDRIAMLLHKIDDLRKMVEGDQRFLEQFS